jgi:AcrR family transcriptional regulator
MSVLGGSPPATSDLPIVPVDADTEPDRRFSLSELVARSGVPASTIHHYRRTGMIPPPVRETANRFGYDERHLEALRVIRGQAAADSPECRARVVAVAIEAFRTRSYSEVTMSDIAEAAEVAKGTVYRHFASKEDLLTAAVESLLADTESRFAAAVTALGGPSGLMGDPEKTAMVFGHLVAEVLPMLLELGARAAKGHEPSADLARHVLRTLAEAAGRPFAGQTAEREAAIKAGLSIIQSAFSTVLVWAVGTDWPPDDGPPEDSIGDDLAATARTGHRDDLNPLPPESTDR